MRYPDTDHLLEQAILAWRSENGQTAEQSIELTRDWMSPQDRLQLRVSYRCQDLQSNQDSSPSTGGPTVHASVDGMNFSLDDPIRLQPVSIDKPWGREIWFSGIEARGESQVVTQGGPLGLASYLAAAPDRLCARRPIVLLKILDPKPEPVLGELYFEVHAEKREVYVVSEIDSNAWPDGRGRIRLGMNQTRRADFPDDAAFRRAFMQTIGELEAIRNAIDSGETGLDAAELKASELKVRQQAEAFTSYQLLTKGDVITVPRWVPHSLQHGVQVVEFQTPTYERYIISFAQAVQTQDHWDSAEAIARMQLDQPPLMPAQNIYPGIERIVDFPDFGVWRATLAPGESLQLPAHIPYAVAMCLSGCLSLSGRTDNLLLNASEAAFMPSSTVSGTAINNGNETGIYLFAAPDL